MNKHQIKMRRRDRLLHPKRKPVSHETIKYRQMQLIMISLCTGLNYHLCYWITTEVFRHDFLIVSVELQVKDNAGVTSPMLIMCYMAS